ncbi:hypothetical protein HanRHA438_Chr16g0784141 [Helianthus annuus]|nr:hypothetical protein HanRHA438_Chr16g0784141 [Helianthus annuus]
MGPFSRSGSRYLLKTFFSHGLNSRGFTGPTFRFSHRLFPPTSHLRLLRSFRNFKILTSHVALIIIIM